MGTDKPQSPSPIDGDLIIIDDQEIFIPRFQLSDTVQNDIQAIKNEYWKIIQDRIKSEVSRHISPIAQDLSDKYKNNEHFPKNWQSSTPNARPYALDLMAGLTLQKPPGSWKNFYVRLNMHGPKNRNSLCEIWAEKPKDYDDTIPVKPDITCLYLQQTFMHKAWRKKDDVSEISTIQNLSQLKSSLNYWVRRAADHTGAPVDRSLLAKEP